MTLFVLIFCDARKGGGRLDGGRIRDRFETEVLGIFCPRHLCNLLLISAPICEA